MVLQFDALMPMPPVLALQRWWHVGLTRVLVVRVQNATYQ